MTIRGVVAQGQKSRELVKTQSPAVSVSPWCGAALLGVLVSRYFGALAAFAALAKDAAGASVSRLEGFAEAFELRAELPAADEIAEYGGVRAPTRVAR